MDDRPSLNDFMVIWSHLSSRKSLDARKYRRAANDTDFDVAQFNLPSGIGKMQNLYIFVSASGRIQNQEWKELDVIWFESKIDQLRTSLQNNEKVVVYRPVAGSLLDVKLRHLMLWHLTVQILHLANSRLGIFFRFALLTFFRTNCCCPPGCGIQPFLGDQPS